MNGMKHTAHHLSDSVGVLKYLKDMREGVAMGAYVLTISPTGQVSLPEALVHILSVGGGTNRVVACAVGDSVVLKPVKVFTAESFKTWMDDARQWAASVGYAEDGVESIVKDVRRRKRSARIVTDI